MFHSLKNFFLLIFYIILYCGFTVAVISQAKWAYGLVLLSALVWLLLLWHEKMNIIKFWAILMIPYSLLVLCGANADFLMEKFGDHTVFMLIFASAETLAMFSYQMVAMVMICLIPMLPFMGKLGTAFIKGAKRRINDKRYGEFPNVQGITKRGRTVYFQMDYAKKEYQLIYRHGHRKKILDIFPYKSGWEHFSLEWEEEDYVVVRQYDNVEHKELMEKKIPLPGY